MTDKSEQDQDPPLTTKDEESMFMKVSDSQTVDHALSDNRPAAIGCSLFCFIAKSLMCMGCMWF